MLLPSPGRQDRARRLGISLHPSAPPHPDGSLPLSARARILDALRYSHQAQRRRLDVHRRPLTSAHLLIQGTNALVLDAGTGLSRLVTHPEILKGAKGLDVLLSHFHLDHVVELGTSALSVTSKS